MNIKFLFWTKESLKVSFSRSLTSEKLRLILVWFIFVWKEKTVVVIKLIKLKSNQLFKNVEIKLSEHTYSFTIEIFQRKELSLETSDNEHAIDS